MSQSETLRAFVAVHLDSATVAALKDAVEALRALNADVRWLPESSWHLTLKFLGEGVARARAPEYLDVVRAEAARTPACTLKFARLGPFPPGKARMVAASFDDDADAQRLVTLAARLDARFDTLGFPSERRAFRPHLTLGRLNGTRGLNRLWAHLEAQPPGALGAGEIREVLFYESVLKPQGAQYTVLGRAPLQA